MGQSNDQNGQGSRVIVRTHGEKALVRRFWSAVGPVILVTDDENLRQLASGRPGALPPIGFPREDVFRWTPKGAVLAAKGRWSELKKALE